MAVNVLDRAQAWIDEAYKLGINMTDENGYLAVIRDLFELVKKRENDLMAAQNGLTQIRQKADRAESDMRVAYRLLERVLSCGLNEEPHGIGFTPSRQERLASDLERDVMDFVSKYAALVRGENIT